MKHQSHNHQPFRPECAEHPVGACLVVIDPEDREQVKDFVAAYFKDFWSRPGAGSIVRDASKPRDAAEPIHVDAMQAALRSLVTPPKPDEPTDLRARVFDAVGLEWAKSGRGCWFSLRGAADYCTWGGAADCCTWDELVERGPLEVQS